MRQLRLLVPALWLGLYAVRAEAQVLTMAEVMRYANEAGVPCDDRLVTAGAVAAAESGLDVGASNCNGNSPPSCDRGLWQINSYWHAEVSDDCAYDPPCNAQAMVAISGGGNDWSPWWAYNYGRHEQYIGDAQAALAEACRPPNAQPVGWLDGAGCDVTGWAQDPDAPDQPLGVHLYIGGPAGDPNAVGIDLGPAGVERADLCGAIGSCSHGFALSLPAAFRDETPRQFWAYTFDASEGFPVMLQGSPATGSCARATAPIAPGDGVKRWVTSPESFGAWRFGPLEVAPLDDATVTSYPDGPVLPEAPVAVQADDGTPEVWVLDGAWRRHVVDPASLAAWRLEGTVQTMPAAEVYEREPGLDWPAAPFVFRGSGPEVWVIDHAEPADDAGGGEPADEVEGDDDDDDDPGAETEDAEPAGSASGAGLGACSLSPASSVRGAWLIALLALLLARGRRSRAPNGSREPGLL